MTDNTDNTLEYARAQPERFRVRWWATASIVPMIVAAIVLNVRDGASMVLGVVGTAAIAAGVIYYISRRRVLAVNLAFAVLMLLLTAGISALTWETSKLKADQIVAEKEARFGWLMKNATDAQNAFVNAGAINAAKLDQPGELDRRIVLLSGLRAQLADAVKVGNDAEADLDRKLRGENVVRWHHERAIAQFNRDTQWSYYAGTMRVTLPFYDRCAELLDYLQKHRDEWSITPGVNNIQFKTPAAKERVDVLRETIRSAAAEVQGAPLQRRHTSTTTSTTRQ